MIARWLPYQKQPSMHTQNLSKEAKRNAALLIGLYGNASIPKYLFFSCPFS